MGKKETNASLGGAPIKSKKRKVEDDSPEVKEINKGFIANFKEKYFRVETLLKFGLYKFNFSEARTVFANNFLARLFREYGYESFEFGCIVKAPGVLSRMTGQRIANVDGLYFMMDISAGNSSREPTMTLYCPIWQRDEAKQKLAELMLEWRPTGCILHSKSFSDTIGDKIDIRLATQHQFINKDVYKHLDRIFKRMVEDETWYLDNGKRFKESILLHGVPGTGKTTVFMHFAAKYQLNVKRMTPYRFVVNFNEIRSQSKNDRRKPLMVLIEDLDACEELIRKEFKFTTSRQDIVAADETEFSYSTFINTLDGSEALNNVIVCMSTNYKERLIPSVVRSGRVDHLIEVKPLNSTEIAAEVNTSLSEYIATFQDGTFSISNIIDLRFCTTQEEIDEYAKWLED